jgi:hypothetical protein
MQKVDDVIKSKNLKILCVHMEHTTIPSHLDINPSLHYMCCEFPKENGRVG